MVMDEDREDESEESVKVRRRKLTRKEREGLGKNARPGAVYRESGWQKRSVEGLHRIQQAVDALERPGGHEASIRGSDLPPGLRSRIREALGPLAFVELSYTTKDHHVCRVGVRKDGDVERSIVLVGPDELRRFDDVASAVDALEAVDPARRDGLRDAQGGLEADPRPFEGKVYDVEDVEGIGTVYGEQLREMGVEDTEDLAQHPVASIAEALDVSERVVTSWRWMAEIMTVVGLGPQYAELLVRSGVEGVEGLQASEPGALIEDIQEKQDSLTVKIQGNIITEDRVETWIRLAREQSGND